MEETVVVEHRWDPPGDGPVVKMVTVNVDELDTTGRDGFEDGFGGHRGPGKQYVFTRVGICTGLTVR